MSRTRFPALPHCHEVGPLQPVAALFGDIYFIPLAARSEVTRSRYAEQNLRDELAYDWSGVRTRRIKALKLGISLVIVAAAVAGPAIILLRSRHWNGTPADLQRAHHRWLMKSDLRTRSRYRKTNGSLASSSSSNDLSNSARVWIATSKRDRCGIVIHLDHDARTVQKLMSTWALWIADRLAKRCEILSKPQHRHAARQPASGTL